MLKLPLLYKETLLYLYKYIKMILKCLGVKIGKVIASASLINLFVCYSYDRYNLKFNFLIS